MNKDLAGNGIIDYRSGALSFEKREDEELLKIIFATETPADRYFGKEILLCRPENVDLTRLNRVGSALFRHDGDKIIGAIKEIGFTENKELYVLIKFDPDMFSQDLKNKVKNGSLRGSSVGYVIEKSIVLGKDAESYLEFTEPNTLIATLWTPWEVSLTPIPVDIYAGVVSREKAFALEIDSLKKEISSIKNNGGNNMPSETLKDESGAAEAGQAESPASDPNLQKKQYSEEDLNSILHYAETSGMYREVFDGLIQKKTKDEIISLILETQKQQREQAVGQAPEKQAKDEGMTQDFSNEDLANALNI